MCLEVDGIGLGHGGALLRPADDWQGWPWRHTGRRSSSTCAVQCRLTASRFTTRRVRAQGASGGAPRGARDRVQGFRQLQQPENRLSRPCPPGRPGSRRRGMRPGNSLLRDRREHLNRGEQGQGNPRRRGSGAGKDDYRRMACCGLRGRALLQSCPDDRRDRA